jgi:hypothetical protein
MNLVKENLKLFVPALVELVDGKDFPWTKIDSLFSEKIKMRKAEFKGETIIIEASIYDIIVEAKQQNSSALGLLDFLDKLFEELNDNLNKTERQLVRRNIKQMLISFDCKYLNFIGEIATLNNLVKSKLFRLLSIEEKISNGKSIDFKLLNIEQNKIMLVEIVNIHLNNDKVVDESEAIRLFLTGKLTDKKKLKSINLNNEIQFYLIPVIWGSAKSLKVYSDFYKSNSLNLEGILEPVAYLTYSDKAGYYYKHYFTTISKLFDEIKT